MKVFFSFIAVVLLCGLSSRAGATPIDFKMGVLDPNPQLSYTSISDPASSFPVSFSTCPTDISADGCFTGYNDTTDLFTSLDLTFANNSVLNGQTPTCDTSVAKSLFGNSSCTYNKLTSTYLLNFFGGTGIAPGAFFFITESGVNPPAGFGTGIGTVGIVPEPSSVVLMATGLMLMLGFFFATGRGRQALESSL
jgi:hypothetical protein